MNEQPFLFGEGWIEVKDGNDTARSIFDRHYSRYRYADGRKPKLIVGPGGKAVLLLTCARALCIWRKFISGDGQQGVNCAVYRNESGHRASDLLLDAMEIAWQRWPGERLYTYVDPLGVPPIMRASRPTWGHCFYQAGWRFCGLTKQRLHILETFPHPWIRCGSEADNRNKISTLQNRCRIGGKSPNLDGSEACAEGAG